MARRRLTLTLEDGRTFSGLTGLKYELNASRIKRARHINGDGYDTEAAAVMCWCVATDNGTAEGAPTLDEILDLENSPVVGIDGVDLDEDGDDGEALGKSTPTAR